MAPRVIARPMEAGPSEAGDPRFFHRTGPHPLAAIAAAVGAPWPAAATPGPMLRGVAPLPCAGADDVSYADHRRHAAAIAATRAGAIIVPPELVDQVPPGSIAIATPTPRLGWARVAALFHPAPPPQPGIHPTAVIGPGASIDPTAEIGPLAVIGAAARIGPGCRIAPLAMIGDGVVLGRDCRIFSHASLTHTLAGDRVTIFPGARIGQDGFGFEPTGQGFLTVPQLGRVILEDDVEIGANSTVDRGSVGDTVIGAGSRLDNLVQIGHNARLGRCCVIVSQAGVSGSTVLEDFVMVAGQAGFAGHLHIGKGARIGGQAGVMADVPAGANVVGSPAMPVKDFFRQIVTLRRLSGQGPRPDKPDLKTELG